MIYLIRAAAVLGLSLMLNAPALARCAICNATVVLDETLATCFVEREEAVLSAMKAKGEDISLIDLSDCSSRGELPVGTSRPSAEALKLDTSFMIDQASVVCLREAIEKAGPAMDNPHVFDLVAICQ